MEASTSEGLCGFYEMNILLFLAFFSFLHTKFGGSHLGPKPISFSLRFHCSPYYYPALRVRRERTERRNDNKSDRYKVFLYVINAKCVGLCLAERITKAYRVKDEDDSAIKARQLPTDHRSSSIMVEEETVLAVVGVSRI